MQESIQPPHPSHDDIAFLAHQLWEKNGRPAGQDVEFWLQAERSLLSSIPPPAPAASQVSPGAAPPRSKAPFDKFPGQKAKKSASKPFKGGAAPWR
jgi:hypothetical protein